MQAKIKQKCIDLQFQNFFFSFERYIRICFYCQLRENSILSEDNIKYYKLFVILFPILFYIPKVGNFYLLFKKQVKINQLFVLQILFKFVLITTYMFLFLFQCFEVRSHYVEKDVTIEIDCQKYLSLSELLKNPLLKSMVGQQFKDADLRKIEFLAENCNQILRQGLQNENQLQLLRSLGRVLVVEEVYVC